MIDPRPLNSVTEWADLSTPDLLQFGPIPKMESDLHWVFWGMNVIQLPKIAAKQPPDPRFYSDWKEWVIRFNQAVLL
jgi:hypothetical protein